MTILKNKKIKTYSLSLKKL